MKKAILLWFILVLILSGCGDSEVPSSTPLTAKQITDFDKLVSQITLDADDSLASFQKAIENLSTGSYTKNLALADANQAIDKTDSLLTKLGQIPAPEELQDIASDYKVHLLSQKDGLEKAKRFLEEDTVNLWGEATQDFSIAEDFKKRAKTKLTYLKERYNLKQ